MTKQERINQLTERIAALEEMLAESAGVGTINQDGQTTQFNYQSGRQELARLKRERARLRGTFKRERTIDLSGF